VFTAKGVGRKISRWGNGKKTKNSTIKPLPRGGRGWQRKKDRKIAKKKENRTFKPLSTTYTGNCIMYENPGGPRPHCRRPCSQLPCLTFSIKSRTASSLVLSLGKALNVIRLIVTSDSFIPQPKRSLRCLLVTYLDK